MGRTVNVKACRARGRTMAPPSAVTSRRLRGNGASMRVILSVTSLPAGWWHSLWGFRRTQHHLTCQRSKHADTQLTTVGSLADCGVVASASDKMYALAILRVVILPSISSKPVETESCTAPGLSDIKARESRSLQYDEGMSSGWVSPQPVNE